MEQTITLSTLIQMGLIIMGFWGFVKIVKEIVKNITDRHDREQKWDEIAKNAEKDKQRVLEEIAKNVQAERDKIYDRYDDKLAEMEHKIEVNEKIMNETNKIIIKGLQALISHGIDGNNIEKMERVKEELDNYLVDGIGSKMETS